MCNVLYMSECDLYIKYNWEYSHIFKKEKSTSVMNVQLLFSSAFFIYKIALNRYKIIIALQEKHNYQINAFVSFSVDYFLNLFSI